MYKDSNPTEEIEITPEMIEVGVAYAYGQLNDLPMAFGDSVLRSLVEGILGSAFRARFPSPGKAS